MYIITGIKKYYTNCITFDVIGQIIGLININFTTLLSLVYYNVLCAWVRILYKPIGVLVFEKMRSYQLHVELLWITPPFVTS